LFCAGVVILIATVLIAGAHIVLIDRSRKYDNSNYRLFSPKSHMNSYSQTRTMKKMERLSRKAFQLFLNEVSLSLEIFTKIKDHLSENEIKKLFGLPNYIIQNLMELDIPLIKQILSIKGQRKMAVLFDTQKPSLQKFKDLDDVFRRRLLNLNLPNFEAVFGLKTQDLQLLLTILVQNNSISTLVRNKLLNKFLDCLKVLKKDFSYNEIIASIIKKSFTNFDMVRILNGDLYDAVDIFRPY